MTQRSDTTVEITLDSLTLDGTLTVPDGASGIVVFAHGSGSSRHRPQNTRLAERLRSRGLGTLLLDLLTISEDQNQANQFDIELLTSRLAGTVSWLREREIDREQSVGLFGSVTGAAAALRVAAGSDEIGAVVSRDGRVDMASDALAAVECPTLLIVDEADRELLKLNRAAYEQLACRKQLYTVPGSDHQFEREDDLEAVAEVTADWFATELQ